MDEGSPLGSDKLTPLQPEGARQPRPASSWRVVSPRQPESCRWESDDGRWVAVTLGAADELCAVVVTASSMRRELADSYEAALALAKSWQD
jgi:hypothetical protein